MPSFKCKDIGMDCSFEAKAKSGDELMKKIGEHAGKVHGIKTMPADLVAKVKKAIKP